MASREMKAISVYKGFQIRDGHGIVFVSNLDEIYPSGFLPLHCGNVRTGSLVDLYRNSEIFLALHAPDQFHGKCGSCEYSHICSGSHARAFVCTGDALGTGPFCPYEPGTAASKGLHLEPRNRA
jgi:radical SAM protein with 4Fe4S-binding SPASM domain